MTARDRAFFPAGINMYVPRLQYASNLMLGVATQFSLGTPAAADNDIIDTDIDSDAVAGTITVQDWTADSPYGRTVTMNANADPGAAGGVYDIYGFDYLGQPLIERFAGVNGSTAVLYGKKAFYRINKSVVITASTNATTFDLGTGFKLGLPYKGDVIWAKENNIMVQVYNRDQWFWCDRGAADAAAGISKWVRAPFPGFVKALGGIPDGGGSTNDPVVTVELGGTAIVGLTATIDTSDVAGLLATDTPTTAGYNANNRFITNGLIELVGAAAASAKGDRVGVQLTPSQFTPADLTNPATRTTGDPRGTYESLTTMDDVLEIVVGLLPDNAYDTSDDGGLHGIAHFYA